MQSARQACLDTTKRSWELVYDVDLLVWLLRHSDSLFVSCSDYFFDKVSFITSIFIGHL